MGKIKVLILTGTMNVGGIENQLMHLLRKSDKEKFQIDFTTTIDNPFYKDEIESLGSKCIRLPKTEGLHFLKYCKALYRVIKENNYDIVHSHELFHSGMVLLTAKLAGVKCRVVHAHNWCDGNNLNEKRSLKRRYYNSFMRCLIRHNATEFVACSTLAGKFLYGENIVNKPNYHLVFNSVDTGKFLDKYDEVPTGEFCEENKKNVIQVGRFSEVKNQLFTVEIAKIFKQRGSNIRILCVGNDGNDYENRVREKIKQEKVEDNILLLGVRKDIDDLMRKSAVFLLPSQYEGMPLVLIEAQTSGIQCIVADTFSHEVDFGIDTVHWLPITESAEYWANEIEKYVNVEHAEKQDVVDAVKKYGFDSNEFANKICDLYKKSVKE